MKIMHVEFSNIILPSLLAYESVCLPLYRRGKKLIWEAIFDTLTKQYPAPYNEQKFLLIVPVWSFKFMSVEKPRGHNEL